jgi:hypothetical protein
MDEKYSRRPSGEIKGSMSLCCPENEATSGAVHVPPMYLETKIVACRENGKNCALSAKYAVLPSGVKVMRHCSLLSEMTPSENIVAVGAWASTADDSAGTLV